MSRSGSSTMTSARGFGPRSTRHVARAWGLTAAELELVFDDFTEDAVPLAYREAVRQRFAA